MNRSSQWKKRGLVFCASGETPSMQSHAAVPIAEHLSNNLFKIYFTSRDGLNRSHTNYIIIDITRPSEILDISDQPVIFPGELGEFDDSGAMASWLVTHLQDKYLYYIGWNLGVTVPFRNSIGLAISTNNTPYVRYSNGPILNRSIKEPHFCASSCVIVHDDIWRMWYLSCTGWRIRQNKPEHRYHIKYAESNDGIHWERNGHVAIDYAKDEEYALSRPSVIRDVDGWKMWYSFRGESYRIGYAESDDGLHWGRLDSRVGIDISRTGWDSEMIEYPFVFDHNGQRYMLYNGNGYGKTGFGIAEWENV